MRRNVSIGLFSTLLIFALVFIMLGCGGSGSGGGGTGGGGGGGVYVPYPIVTSVTNLQGSSTVTVAEEIVISGSGFGSYRSLKYNNESYVSFHSETGEPSVKVETYLSWKDNEIRCIVPNLKPGREYFVVVYVVTSSGSYNSSATPSQENTVIVQAPRAFIFSIVPSTVNQGSGAPITITGTNFGSGGVVNFGSISVYATSWNESSITVNVPRSLVIGTVNVSVSPIEFLASNSKILTIVSPTAPTLIRITPSSVPQGIETNVTLEGTNLGSQGNGYVLFGTVRQPIASSWTETRIICKVPPSLIKGVYDVSVVTDQNGSTNTVTLFVGIGKIYALFVGINQYAHASDLRYCVNDVNGIKNNLNVYSGSIWNDATIVTLIDTQATKNNIYKTINSFVQTVTSQDTFFFFYAGHGSNSGGHTYIVPTDSDLTPDSCIEDVELNNWLAQMIPGAKKVIIFDSCHSGGFVGKSQSKDILSRFIPIEGSSQTFEGSDFSKQLETLNNLVFLAACKGSESSWESSSIGHGYFTYYLMEGLGNGSFLGPAASGGAVTAEGDFNYAAPRTKNAVAAQGSLQNPQIQDNYSGQLEIKK